MQNIILYIITAVLLFASFIKSREKTKKALLKGGKSFSNILPSLLGIISIVGIIIAFLNPERISSIIGESSGILGIILAAVFMKKGVKLSNILIFIGAWSTTKIPMFLFELNSLGPKFALTRLWMNIPGILIIAYTIPKLLKKEEIEDIYKKAERLD